MRASESVPPGSVSVVYDGTKFYWRTRNTIDVCIVQHTPVGVLEVIAYDPSFNAEAPRIYIDLKVFTSKISQTEIDSKLSFAKRNNVPLTEKFVRGVHDTMYSEFILNRLVLKEYSLDEKKMVVELSFTAGDLEAEKNDHIPVRSLVCDRPEQLVPHKTSHHRLIM
jgi:hypothetical protein